MSAGTVSPRRDALEDDAAAGRQRLQDEPGAHAGVQPLAVHDDAASRSCAAAGGAARAAARRATGVAAAGDRGAAPARARRARGRPRAAARRAGTASRGSRTRPSRITRTAVSMLPWPEITMIGHARAPAVRMRRTSSMPSISGIQMSTIASRGTLVREQRRAPRGRPPPRPRRSPRPPARRAACAGSAPRRPPPGSSPPSLPPFTPDPYAPQPRPRDQLRRPAVAPGTRG